MADFYFTDRKYNQLGIASTDELASSSVIAIDDIGGQEGDYQSVDGGYRSYSATLHFSPDQSAQVKEMAKVGNFVLFKGRAGESVWTTILSSEHDPLAGTNTFVAEDASIDLINGTVGAYAASSAMTIAQYIELFAGDSGFVIGYNEIPDLTRTLKWDSDDSSILTRILSVATQFGVELSFRFEVRGLSVIGKYIDIRKHIGGNKGIYLHVDTDLNKIVTTSDIADLCTAIAGTGGTPEGSNDPITLKGYHWIDPNGRYVLGDDGVLRDPVALRTWSRLLSNTNTNPVDAHITRNKTYEATTQATLIQSVLSDLEKFNHPAVNYEVDIAKLPDNVNIGDTVYLVDEDEQLFLSARVLELTYSYSNESGTATLGDYLIQASQVDPAYRELADQIKNMPKVVQYYPWIRYADDDKGTNMSAFPANKKYMAFRYSNKSSVPSDNPADYAGKWALIQGKDGADGVPGTKGADGRTSYFHTAWADDASGQNGFTVSSGDGKKYIGTYSDFTLADSTNPSDYNWALFKGEDGKDGKDGYTPIKGTDYFDGKDGQDGKSSYLWIRYSANANGNDMTIDPTGAKYVGYATTQTTLAPTLASAYKWQLVAGKDGIAGEKGADGKTSYLHIRYSNDGGQTFTANSGETVGTHIGQYTDFTQSDSNSVSAYKWALIKGDKGDTGDRGADGVAGKDGVGLKSTVVTYQLGSSGTTKPTGTWSATVPTLTKGQYLWTKTTWIYSDSSSEDGFSIAYIAKDGSSGADGLPGKDGTGIKSTVIEYAVSSNGVTKPSTGWLATIPSVAAGQFMWTRTTWSYTDGTNEVGYSVAQAGATGPKGDTGPQGPQGPQGPPGSQNVPMTYVQTAAPTGTIVTNSLWWVGATMSSVTALKRWNGSSWIPDSIAQAVLNIIELNAVIINSAIINSPKINVPFTHAPIEGGNILSTGKLTLNGTAYTIDGTIEDSNGNPNGQNYHTELNPDGLLSYLTQTDGTTQMNASRISMGTLELTHLVSGLGTSATYITSSLNAEKIYQLNNVSNPLWQGVSLLGWSGDAQSVTPSKKITDCLNGWKLVWGEYSNGTFSGTGIRETEISKTSVLKYPGAGRILSIMNYGNANCSKYVYAYADHIDGNTKNSDGAAGGVVLVGVYEY
jgi:phage minor structural protein